VRGGVTCWICEKRKGSLPLTSAEYNGMCGKHRKAYDLITESFRHGALSGEATV
jgi:hypothetical protein